MGNSKSKKRKEKPQPKAKLTKTQKLNRTFSNVFQRRRAPEPKPTGSIDEGEVVLGTAGVPHHESEAQYTDGVINAPPNLSLEETSNSDDLQGAAMPEEIELSHTVEAHAKDKESQLCMEIIAGNVANVRHLLRAKADPNRESVSGITPLHLALLSGNKEMILALLDADNLDLQAKTKKPFKKDDLVVDSGSNALHILAHRGNQAGQPHINDVEHLFKTLSCFIDVDERDGGNKTPADIARFGDIVRILTTMLKVKATWKAKAASRLQRLQERRASEAACAEKEDELTVEEKQRILDAEEDLMTMKIYPLMVELMRRRVLGDSDAGRIAEECRSDKMQAIKYIIHNVLALGTYKRLEHFHAALMSVSQDNLAATLPLRPAAPEIQLDADL